MSSTAQVISLIEPRAAANILTDYPEPADTASSERLKATLWQVAAIVTATISSLFIGVGIFTQFIVPFSPLFFLILLGGPFAIGTLYSNFMDSSYKHESAANTQDKVLKKLQEFENFSHARMAALLWTHQIDLSKIPRADYSSRDFKILFAHFLLYVDRIQTVRDKLANSDHPIRLTAESSDNEFVHYYAHRSYLKEWGVYPDKIRAACIMQRMYLPQQQVLLSDRGEITPKFFDKRQASQMFLREASPYFVFRDGRTPAISLSEMEYQSIPQLNQRLFRV